MTLYKVTFKVCTWIDADSKDEAESIARESDNLRFDWDLEEVIEDD